MLTISNNTSPSFTSGITRKLSRNIYPTPNNIKSVFERHPQKNGIAGQLPKFIIDKLNLPQFASDKRKIIQEIYEAFENFVMTASDNLRTSIAVLNKVLGKYNLGNYSAEKINTKGCSYILNGYILKSKDGKNHLFIKEFKDIPEYTEKIWREISKYHGKFMELARAMQVKHRIKDRHLMKTYWGDTKASYMVSEYVSPSTNCEPISNDWLLYSSRKEFVENLKRKYGFTDKELNRIKIGYEQGEKFYAYPESNVICNYFEELFKKLGLIPRDIRDNYANLIVTTDEKGNRLIKLIDLGGIKEIGVQ